MAKIAAHSTPSRLPGNKAMNGAMAMAWNPRMGTDCRMSSIGIIAFSAVRYLAAMAAKTKLNNSEKASAVNMRRMVRNR